MAADRPAARAPENEAPPRGPGPRPTSTPSTNPKLGLSDPSSAYGNAAATLWGHATPPINDGGCPPPGRWPQLLGGPELGQRLGKGTARSQGGVQV